MSENYDELLYFFYRPTKPIFTPKGLHQNVYFTVPESLYPKEYKHVAKDFTAEIENKLASELVISSSKPINEESVRVYTIEDVPINVDLNVLKKIQKDEHFLIFDTFHADCAAQLIRVFTECEAKNLRHIFAKLNLEGVNHHLLIYAFSVALVHRPETEYLPIPSPVTYSPEHFIERSTIREALNEGYIVNNEAKRNYIPLNPTASDLDIENRIAYFREDIGVNMHHWHWHLVYPYKAEGPLADKIVKKDRRGELFAYMHQQIIARYNFERFCNKLHRTVGLTNIYEPLPEGYFPKLESPYTKTRWASREAYTKLRDLNMRDRTVKMTDMELWRDRILNAIHSGEILTENGLKRFDAEKGMDDLGNIVEASILSLNKQFFGNLHNSGHMIISYAHDPDNKYLEGVGCMGDNRTAMRDPLFYRWHSFVDDLFQEYKKTLTPYTVDELKFDAVEITEFDVVTRKNDDLGIKEDVKNKFYTYTQTDLVNLAYGLDIKDKGSVYVQFPHLQQQTFDYNIKVKNTGEKKDVTVRIFLGPSRDELNKKYNQKNPTFPLDAQRRFFIELDKFTATLEKDSEKTITRSSKDSTVTIPFKQMFADVGDILNELNKNPADRKDTSQMAYCGCGWPDHLLIPKGTYSGFPAHLFVMLTDYKQDEVSYSLHMITEEFINTLSQVKEDIPTIKIESYENVKGDDASTETSGSKGDCKCPKAVTAVSYCGLKNKKYPDKKPMGFPFDRLPREGVKSIEDFCQYKKSLSDEQLLNIPNMKFTDVLIHHVDVTLPGETVGDISQMNANILAMQKKGKIEPAKPQ